MNEIEMIENFHILNNYDGEEFKTKLEEMLEGLPEDLKEDFLHFVKKDTIIQLENDIQKKKIIEERQKQLEPVEI